MNILVIKHGALGDIVLAFPAFAAIRAAHPHDRVSLLTTSAYAAFLAASPWFNHVETDRRPAFWDLAGLWRLRHQLTGFDLVYDLQTSTRSTRYFALAGRPRWSGIAADFVLRHDTPGRGRMHSRERLAEQLSLAGIGALPAPDLAWLRGNAAFGLPAAYAVLVPGAAPHRPRKRWPPEAFGALAAALALPPVILGAASERPLAAIIQAKASAAIDLTGRTSLPELSSVIAGAALAIGNDTGPMHLAAAFGVPSVVLFGPDSEPKKTAPRYPDGGWPTILREADLADLPVARVLAALP